MTWELDLVSSGGDDLGVSPHQEMGAYEALWDENGATFKTIFEKLQTRPNAVPSELVEPSRAREYSRIVGAAGVLAGIVLTLFIPNMLPGQLDTRVAGFVMGQDRWNAGVTMMRVADPEGWRGVVDSSQLVRDNAETIG
ncbi:MAG: DUF6118 family protein, partial [Rhizobiaceae bacterium]